MDNKYTPEQQAALDRIFREGEELKAKRDQEKEDRYLEQVDSIESDIASITTEIEHTKQCMLESGTTQILLDKLEALVIERCNQKIALQELHDDYQEECYYGY